MFNITAEEREEIIRVLARDESEAVGSMGDDTPMPVLSHHTRNLYDYFRQQFAQVTNPPIDPLRESIVMSLQTEIGPECNVFQPQAAHAQQIVLNSPVLSQRKLRQIVALADEGVPNAFIDLQYAPAEGLQDALQRICREAEAAVRDGNIMLLLSDRYLVRDKIPIHALLATGAIHHHLVKQRAALQVQPPGRNRHRARSASFRLPHRLWRHGRVSVHGVPDAVRHDEEERAKADEGRGRSRIELGRSYRKAIRKGLLKIISKMGISTIASYRSGPAVRDRRAGRRRGGHVLPRHAEPHQGRELRRPAGRPGAAGASAPGTTCCRWSMAAC